MELKHQEILNTFNSDYSAGEDQRDLANEDIRFIAASGGHWEGFLEDFYGDRPRMQYDMIAPAVNRFVGEYAANEVLPKFKDENPNDDIDDADFIDGLFRSRWRKEGGKGAAKNAVFETACGGMGAIRLGTRYLDDYDAESEKQEITFTAIHGACTTVVFDSNAQRMDKRDANHVSVIWEYSEDAFKRKWPDKECTSATRVDDRREFNWNSKNGVYVVEFYEKIERKVTVHIFVNQLGQRFELEEKEYELGKPELELQGFTEIKKRKVKRVHIEKSILSGNDFLEEPRRIAGKILPIIPFYAYWCFTDGQENYWGIVRKEKDPQRVLNMNISNLAEIAGTSPKEAPIFDPQQVRGLEKRWAEAHLGKKNYHLARALRDEDGNVIQTGPIGTVRPPQIDPATQGLIQVTTDHIRATTGGMPQDIEDPDASGKAILAVQKRVDMDTYIIMDNIAESMCRLGECFASIAQEIYTDTRKVTLISEDGTESQSQMNQSEIVNGKIVNKNSLQGKKFEVFTTVGPSYESQRRETIEFMKELIQFLPEGDPRTSAVVSSIIDNMDGVGLGSIKDLNRKLMLLSGLVEPKNDEEKAMLAQEQQAQQQPDGMQQLIESQTALNMAEAEGKQATSIEKMASAEKKAAEAAKIIQDIGLDKAKLLMEALDKQVQ